LSGKSALSTVSSVVIHVRSDLASEFFRESGDLPIAGFQATNELAMVVGKLLGYDRDEGARITLEPLKSRKVRKK